MTIPLKVDMDTGSEPLAPPREKQNLKRVREDLEIEPSSFDKLLSDRIESLRARGDLTSPVSLLDREKLQNLVEIVRIQLNHYLFSALPGFDEEGIPSASEFEGVDFIEMGNQARSFSPEMMGDLTNSEGTLSQGKFDNIINRASDVYGVEPQMIKAVIRAESDFDATCTSRKGAMGLMQLMPETARELGVNNPYHPVENIMAGTRYLKSLLDRYGGNVSLALAAYNWGMGNLERNPHSLPRETRTYIARVKEFYLSAKA
ncbi:MAG: lytic transglycosylase domain-containing protein [Pseudomonadota bacterium]